MNVKLLLVVCVTFLAHLNSARAGTLAFNYDQAGRLTTATFADSKTIAYTYDAAGNHLQRQISVGGNNPDSDNDGLTDAWEQLYFGNLSRNGAGDFDNDGFPDRSEFLAGTVPTNSASALRLFGKDDEDGNGLVLRLSVGHQ